MSVAQNIYFPLFLVVFCVIHVEKNAAFSSKFFKVIYEVL